MPVSIQYMSENQTSEIWMCTKTGFLESGLQKKVLDFCDEESKRGFNNFKGLLKIEFQSLQPIMSTRRPISGEKLKLKI